jgi:dTDP-4-amino-4,6-dideoxygalactose transaminase
MIYYPVPLQEQAAFRSIVHQPTDLAHSNQLCTQVLSLPMHSELDEAQLAYITDSIKAFFE